MTRVSTAVVLTFPRSGSSLLAGIIHRLGVPMGAEGDLGLGRHLNRHGCHEDQTMQRISLNLLFEAGLLLDLERRLDIDEALLSRTARRWDGAMATFTARRRGTVWGFKDPSLLYALPYLEHHLDNPRYVVLTRGVDATARSLHRTFRASSWWPELREKWPLFTWRNRLLLAPHALALRARRTAAYHDPAFFRRVVDAGHARIAALTDDRDHLRVELEALAADPRAEIDRLIAFLGLEPDKRRLDAARGFVEPSLLTP